MTSSDTRFETKSGGGFGLGFVVMVLLLSVGTSGGCDGDGNSSGDANDSTVEIQPDGEDFSDTSVGDTGDDGIDNTDDTHLPDTDDTHLPDTDGADSEEGDPPIEGPVVIDHECTNLSAIPPQWIERVKTDLHIVYQHTSHGSQLITGITSLRAFPAFGFTYDWDTSGAREDALDLHDNGIPGEAPDLSQGDWEANDDGDTPWVLATRSLLDLPANSHINVVMWSWCSINGHDAERYVTNMEKLIVEYPDVTFVFMTGHAEGEGESMAEDGVHYNNELIRAHCAEHNRLLFDFADIEAHNPDGSYFWDRAMWDNLDYDDNHNWAVEWIAANPDSELARLTTGAGVDGYGGTQDCAHSDSPQEANLNCVLKGRAAWWMFARIAGWDGR